MLMLEDFSIISTVNLRRQISQVSSTPWMMARDFDSTIRAASRHWHVRDARRNRRAFRQPLPCFPPDPAISPFANRSRVGLPREEEQSAVAVPKRSFQRD